MPTRYWLVKQEPETYAWDQFVREGQTAWTGVRNFQARNHLRAMSPGDLVLYYHSGADKRIVGVASVALAAYPDPTATEGNWVAVDLVPIEALPRPIPLAEVRAESRLCQTALIKQTRLSVLPLTRGQFRKLLTLGGWRNPAPAA